jgi:hypothetical protein
MAYPEKGPVATGTTDAEGRFTLSSGSDQPGVALGPVRVAVTKRASSDAAPVPEGTTPSGEEFVDPTKAMEAMRTQQEASREGNAPSTPESEIPAQYASPETSGLTFEIKAGDNDLPITLQ